MDAEEFLHRVLNQNEQAHGWVYLHPDGDVGIVEPAVAMLRVSISLSAKEHYELIRKARCGRLDTEYRNKLGWLKGNLYSRIDTTDWAERDSGDVEEKTIIKDLLDAPIADFPPLWVPKAWIAEATKKVALAEVPTKDLVKVLHQHAPKPPLEVALSEVKRLIDLMRADFTNQPADAYCLRVETDRCIVPLLSHAITQIVGDVIVDSAYNRRWRFYESLVSDSILLGLVAAELGRQATAFNSNNGPRNVDRFIDKIAATPILATDSVNRISFWVEEVYGADYLGSFSQIVPALLALCPLQPLVDYLRSVAVSCIQESLAERVASRLTNDATFKKCIKVE